MCLHPVAIVCSRRSGNFKAQTSQSLGEIHVRVLVSSVVVCLGLLHAQVAQARGLAEFALIGFGAAFINDVMQSETCRSMGEALSGSAAAGIVGAAGGAVVGGIMGSGDNGGLGGVALGGLVGSMIGRVATTTVIGAGTSAGSSVASDWVVRSERELGEKFEFQTCLLLKSSELIRTPLVYRYDFLIRRHCNQAGNYNPTVEMTDGLLRCLNNDYPEARDITLALIALNQSTCRSIMTSKAILIQNLLDSLDQSDGQSAFPAGTAMLDPECNHSPPAEVWQSFISSR